MAIHNFSNHAALQIAFDAVAAPALPLGFADGDVVVVGTVSYEVKTSLKTDASADGAFLKYRGLYPIGEIKLEHWDAAHIKVDDASNTSDGRYLPTPTVSASTAIQKAFRFCLSHGLDLDGDVGRVYGITWQHVWGADAVVSPAGSPTLRNTNLVWIGAASTEIDNSGVADPDEWLLTEAALVVGKLSGSRKYPVAVENVRVDGRRLRSAIHFSGAEARTQRFRAERGLDYEVLIGRTFKVGDYSPGGYIIPSSGQTADGFAVGDEDNRYSCTDCKFEGRGRHFAYGEYADGTFETGGLSGATEGTGWWGMAGRTSHGLVVRSSDVEFDVTFATGYNALIAGAGWSQSYQNSKFWLVPDLGMYAGGVGAANADTKITVIITERCKGYAFSNGRVQDGMMDVYSSHGGIEGMAFDQAHHAPIRLNFAADSDNYKKFRMLGNHVASSSGAVIVRDLTTMTTYTGSFDGAFHGNVTIDGDTLKVCGYETVMGGFRHSGVAFDVVNANKLSVQRSDQAYRSMVIMPSDGSESGAPVSANLVPIDSTGALRSSDQLVYDFSTSKWRVGWTDGTKNVLLSV